jgi:S-formylglutathione hydrolase FrmB
MPPPLQWGSLRGRLEELWVDSPALAGNPLGDDARRPCWVYVPPGYDADPEAGRRYPAVYELQGFTGQIEGWRNRSPFRPGFVELVDALFAEDRCPPCLVVFVDAWTAVGGSQFLDSPGVGDYHTYLCVDVVGAVDAAYRTLPSAAHRGVQGKSSGGYGAMVTAMLRPDVFGALATHAGDALFELCYLPDFGNVTRALRDTYGGSYERFWEDFRSRPAFSRPADHSLLNTYAMAACYSADTDGTVRLPFDAGTGRLDPEVWERWLAWDPVRMAPRRADALRSMRAVWIDAGRRDEFYLDLGAEAFRRELDALGVRDVRFELFDAGHGAIEYRYPLALRHLAERLQPSGGAGAAGP